MNLLSVRVPLIRVKDNKFVKADSFIDYTVILNEVRFNNFNHSVLLPEKTIINNDVSFLLKSFDWDADVFNISFIQRELMKDFNVKLKNKKINTGLLTHHEIASEILSNTPVYINKDSVNDSLWLINLSKLISNYESVISLNFVDELINVRKSIERVKPFNSNLNIACFSNGFAFSGPSVSKVKDGFSVKHWGNHGVYDFSLKGSPFYSLGSLASLCLKLDDLWN